MFRSRKLKWFRSQAAAILLAEVWVSQPNVSMGQLLHYSSVIW